MNAEAPIQWAAQLDHVRDITLVGSADLGYWKEQLRPRDLHPTVREGKAELLIVCADAKFMGVPFREVSFSVSVSRSEGGETRDGAFLLQAFQSVRFFAFVERVMFSTPYHHAKIGVGMTPASVALTVGRESPFVATMADEAGRAPTRTGEDGWQGPVYLPTKDGGAGKQFVAKVSGQTQVFAATAGDVVKLTAMKDYRVFEMLLASGFAACEWHVRPDAKHAKGKTVARASAESRQG